MAALTGGLKLITRPRGTEWINSTPAQMCRSRRCLVGTYQAATYYRCEGDAHDNIE